MRWAKGISSPLDQWRSCQPATSRKDALSKGDFVTPGPLWQAYTSPVPSVVLLDEVDKAPRDFPNDRLNVLDQHSFSCPERNAAIERHGAPPIIIITSNSERRLPEPFLRRCVFHHIELTEALVARAVAARRGEHAALDVERERAALARFYDIRERDLRKPPSDGGIVDVVDGVGRPSRAGARMTCGRLTSRSCRGWRYWSRAVTTVSYCSAVVYNRLAAATLMRPWGGA